VGQRAPGSHCVTGAARACARARRSRRNMPAPPPPSANIIPTTAATIIQTDSATTASRPSCPHIATFGKVSLAFYAGSCISSLTDDDY